MVAVTASGVNDDQVLTSADVGLTMVRFLTSCLNLLILKGLGRAILGNFSTDEMVIESTKIWK